MVIQLFLHGYKNSLRYARNQDLKSTLFYLVDTKKVLCENVQYLAMHSIIACSMKIYGWKAIDRRGGRYATHTKVAVRYLPSGYAT